MLITCCPYRRSKGFTIIELMVVVVIIAVIAAIMIPNYVRSRQQAMYNSCAQNIRSIGIACQMYANDNNGYYPASFRNKAMVPKYLSDPKRLNCPYMTKRVGGGMNFYDYTLKTHPKNDFIISCGRHSTYTKIQFGPLYCPSAGGLITDPKECKKFYQKWMSI